MGVVICDCEVPVVDRFGSEDEALQVLADLHGKGDKTNEVVVFEFEEIKQQVSHPGTTYTSANDFLGEFRTY